MPHHKSAVKRLRTNEKSRKRNVVVKSALRKQIKRQGALEGEAARDMIPKTYAELDRAVRKGVIPKSRANRLKSRLTIKAAKSPSS